MNKEKPVMSKRELDIAVVRQPKLQMKFIADITKICKKRHRLGVEKLVRDYTIETIALVRDFEGLPDIDFEPQRGVMKHE